MSKVICEREDIVAIADAVRSKGNTTEAMTLGEIKTAVYNIKSASPTQEKTVDIAVNGTVEIAPDEGYVLSKVITNVDIPEAPTQEKIINITENGIIEITPDSGYRLSKIIVNVRVQRPLAAGLYQSGAIALYEEQGAEAIEGMMIKPWDELIDNVIFIDDNKCLTANSDALQTLLPGDLVMPNDESVTSIGKNALCNCRGLTNIIISNSVTSIGDYAFQRCNHLTSITIPDSVTSIGTYAFGECYKMVEVINKSSLPITLGQQEYGYVAYWAKEIHNGTTKIVNQNGYLFYTYDGVNYLLGYVGADTELTLPESYNGQSYEIYDYAFYHCNNLISIAIPDSITIIPKYGYCNCANLTDVTIGNGVVNIDNYAFQNCDGLMSITIPSNVGNFGAQAFAGCDNLSEMHFTGTTSQWKTLGKGSNWYRNTPLSEVQCSDGKVSLT